jgi:putative flavoprotein involved in K+ transport
MVRQVETVVVGAGQAGLTMSRYLGQAGRDHLVVDRRSRLGGGWQDRWTSFRLVTPNWSASFPGQPYDGTDPGGYMPGAEIADRVARYAQAIRAPVALETDVELLQRRGGWFRLETSAGAIDARQVIVAAGSFHGPRIPPIAGALPGRLVQLHSHAYRDQTALPPGAILVVGSGQSGVQIAEELADAGRRVFLSVGHAGRVPRRYRGSDVFRWLRACATDGEAYGTPLPSVTSLPDPRLRSAGNPHVSGHGGGHDTNLRRLAAEGMTLIGRIEGVDGERLRLAPDLAANLASADRFFDERFRTLVDTYIERAGLDAPPDDRQPFAYDPAEPTELDLAGAGISTVLWTTGYALDYTWIDLPIFDPLGFPRQTDGLTEVPGLAFLGLLWQRNQASATLFGVGLDALVLASRLGIPVSGEDAAAAASPPPAD